MKYAIISDIHGNLEALEAVRAELEKAVPEAVFCLGDVVGYGASPAECIRAAREIAKVTVAGNHDFGVTGQTEITYFNRFAREAIVWTARHLDPEDIDYLRGMPLAHSEQAGMRFVHATPADPGQWNYIFTHQQAVEQFKAFAERICFVGHSHQPCIFELMDEDTLIVNSDRVKVMDGRRYIVNVGSVGQPRDGDPRACLCVYDLDSEEITVERVAYDIEGAQKRIKDAGLPAVLANRLSWGE